MNFTDTLFADFYMFLDGFSVIHGYTVISECYSLNFSVIQTNWNHNPSSVGLLSGYTRLNCTEVKRQAMLKMTKAELSVNSR